MKQLIVSTLLVMFVTGCASAPPPKTQLQIREYQTHTFDTKDLRQTLKACLNALQDDGYIVKNAVPDLGLLTATKQLDVENKTGAVILVLFGGANARWAKNSETEVTVNVSELGNQVQVRANFSLKVIDNKGGVVDVKQIQEQAYYQEFFSKVDKAIFLEATFDRSKPRPEHATPPATPAPVPALTPAPAPAPEPALASAPVSAPAEVAAKARTSALTSKPGVPPPLAVGTKLFNPDGSLYGTVTILSRSAVAVLQVNGYSTVTVSKEEAISMQR